MASRRGASQHVRSAYYDNKATVGGRGSNVYIGAIARYVLLRLSTKVMHHDHHLAYRHEVQAVSEA